jgi:hypothetical protein
MNSIVFTHVVAAPEGACPLDLALDRLGAFLDAERDALAAVLAQAGRRQAAGALESLDQLHLEPGAGPAEIRAVLEEAQVCLEVLLETLRALPRHGPLQTAWGLPGPDAFDRHVRWSGARLEDILATLRHALAA